MAARLGFSVSEAQFRISSREFVEWVEFLDWEEWRKPKRIHYYQAQIAHSMVVVNSKNPGKYKVKDFLLKFKEKKKKSAEEQRKEGMRMKAAFLSYFGMKDKNHVG